MARGRKLFLLLVGGVLLAAAAFALMQPIRQARELSRLAQGLRSSNPQTRLAVVQQLSGMKGEEPVTLLVSAVADGDEHVRSAVQGALAASGSAAIGPLAAALQRPDPATRLAAAQALGATRVPGAVRPLVIALHGSDELTRMDAAEALGRTAQAEAVDPLVASLSDPSTLVRARAAEALGRLKDARAVEPLIRALSDADSYVRVSAAAALGEFGDPRAIGPLVANLGDCEITVVGEEDFSVTCWAAESLAKYGAPAVGPLVHALRDARVSTAAAYGLGKIGTPAVKALVAALGDPDPHVQGGAAFALGQMRARAAVEPLLAVAQQGGSARHNVVRALGRIGGARAVPVLAGMLRDREGRLRKVAARALVDIGDRDGIMALKEADPAIVAELCSLIIQKGLPGTEAMLISSFQKAPNLRMAERFIESGNQQLESVAWKWVGKQKDLRLVPVPGTPTRWGNKP